MTVPPRFKHDWMSAAVAPLGIGSLQFTCAQDEVEEAAKSARARASTDVMRIRLPAAGRPSENARGECRVGGDVYNDDARIVTDRPDARDRDVHGYFEMLALHACRSTNKIVWERAR